VAQAGTKPSDINESDRYADNQVLLESSIVLPSPQPKPARSAAQTARGWASGEEARQEREQAAC